MQDFLILFAPLFIGLTLCLGIVSFIAGLIEEKNRDKRAPK